MSCVSSLVGARPVTERVVAFETIEFDVDLWNVGCAVSARLVLDDPPSQYLTDSFTVRRMGVDPPSWFPSGRRLQSVTAEGIRTVPVDGLINMILRQHGVETPPWDQSWRVGGAQLRQAGTRDETALRFVADVYLTEALRGGPPLNWVAHELECSDASAGRWIAAAKDAGYLHTASRQRRS